MTKAFLDKSAFLSQATNLKKEGLEIEGFGLVGVRELNGKQIRDYNARIRELKQKDPDVNVSNALEILALLVSMSVCDEEGKLLFTEDDVPALIDISFDSLIKIASKTLELSGLSKGKADEAADSLKKALSDSPITVSPTSSGSL